MKATFITNGQVEEFNADDPTKATYYMVGRRGYKTPIRLSEVIPAYLIEGNHIKIDEYGNAWVKA